MATLSARSIRSFKYLVGSFISQFAANRVKRLEVADLFDIKQAKDESLKSYLARFNNATVWVNDPNQKFFMKSFQKGLRVGKFNDALALRKPISMEEIRARAEKHIEAKEDQVKWLETERQSPRPKEAKLGSRGGHQKREIKHQVLTQQREIPLHFTPPKGKKSPNFVGNMLHAPIGVSQGGERMDDGGQPGQARGKGLGSGADQAERSLGRSRH
ncbi:hypothetical protein CR513_48006, partial [Mucuna pruriens]